MSYNLIITVAIIGFFIDRFFSWREQVRMSRITESTHTIVNNERSIMLETIADLSARIAADNPSDQKAQRAAKTAKDDASRSDRSR